MHTSYTQRPLLEPGWGYFQISRVDTLTKDGKPLVSKKGNPMLKVNLQVTDSRGATEFVTDWIVSDLDWKIANVQEALQITNLYDKQTGRFDIALLQNKCGACSLDIQSSDQYGDSVRIKMYVPMEFIKMLNQEEKVEALPLKTKNDYSPPVPAYVSSQASDNSIDDDIPF
jgi:hypothetical protein